MKSNVLKDPKQIFFKYGILMALIVLLIVFTVMQPAFMSIRNITNIFVQASIMGIIAMGMSYVIISGGIDLSVGSVVALSGIVATMFSSTDYGVYPVFVSIAAGVGTGIICGLVNGVLIAKWNIAPFIVTLAMMSGARGLALVITGREPVKNIVDAYTGIGEGNVGGLPIPIIIFAAVTVLSIFLLTSTRFGRYVYSVGGNEKASVFSGINIVNIKILLYTISGLCAAIAAIVLSSRTHVGQPVAGQNYELDAISAVVVGGISLSGGRGSIVGTLIGVLMLGAVNNGLNILSIGSYWQQIIKGVIIILAVLLDARKK